MLYTSTEDRRLTIATHEIGHCAAALLLGVAVPNAAIFDNSLLGGIATMNDVATATPGEVEAQTAKEYESLDDVLRKCTWETLLNEATMSAAGGAAVDLIYHPEKGETWLGGSDIDVVYAIARAAVPTACDMAVLSAFTIFASARARALLRPFLDRIERAALELATRGRMTADEIVSAMYPEHMDKQPARDGSAVFHIPRKAD